MVFQPRANWLLQAKAFIEGMAQTAQETIIYGCRIANIDVQKLLAGEVDLLALLRKGYFKVKTNIKKAGQKTFIYCNTTVAEVLDAAAADKANVQLNIKEYCGEDIAHYKGIPIRVIDQILDTEIPL